MQFAQPARHGASPDRLRSAAPLLSATAARAGRPLDADTRAATEPRLGHDFSKVRVHTGEDADRSARALGAAAYTVGSDIAFRAGRYAPATPAGQALIEHELRHVADQHTGVAPMGAVQRADETTTPAAVPALAPVVEDDETRLGNTLWSSWRDGVNVAFYGGEWDPQTKHFADGWAKREQALGPTGTTISAKTLAFGRSIADSMGFEATLTAMSAVLVAAAAKTTPVPSTTPGAVPAGNPAKFKTVAIFSHGWQKGVHFAGEDFRNRNIAAKVKAVAPTLGQNVNIIFYACSAARGLEEKDENIWRVGTMQSGGAGSLAGTTRDALLQEGVGEATVWSHTTIGTANSNFALRRFGATSGAGTPGESYVSTDIFTATERASALADLEAMIVAQGYAIDSPAKFNAVAEDVLTYYMYNCYAQANADFKYGGKSLGEAAPIAPAEVATIVRDHWNNTFWPSKKAAVAGWLIKQLKLKKPMLAPAPAAPTPK